MSIQVIQNNRPRISDAIGQLSSTLQHNEDQSNLSRMASQKSEDEAAADRAAAIQQVAVNRKVTPEQWSRLLADLKQRDPAAARHLPDISGLPLSDFERAQQTRDASGVQLDTLNNQNRISSATKIGAGTATATDFPQAYNPQTVGTPTWRSERLSDVLRGGSGASSDQVAEARTSADLQPKADVALRESTEGPLRTAQAGLAKADTAFTAGPKSARENAETTFTSGPRTKEALAGATEKNALAGKHNADAKAATANAGTVDIKASTPEFRAAQALAYGGLTFQQFTKLYAYSRDPRTKVAIYSKAQDLNPAFDAAAFELGYKFAANPKVRQQISSADNAMAMIPEAISISDRATRLGPNALNKLFVGGGVALGGRKYNDYRIMQTAFADEISGALGFGSATDMTRELGLKMTDLDLSSPNFKSAMQIVGNFLDRKRGSLVSQMGVYGPDVDAFSANKPATTMPQQTAPQQSDSSGKKVIPSATYDDAVKKFGQAAVDAKYSRGQ